MGLFCDLVLVMTVLQVVMLSSTPMARHGCVVGARHLRRILLLLFFNMTHVAPVVSRLAVVWWIAEKVLKKRTKLDSNTLLFCDKYDVVALI